MVYDSLRLMTNVFHNCAIWVNSLLDAVDGGGIVLTAFCFVLVVDLLFKPLRGSTMSDITSFSLSKIYKAKPKFGSKKGHKNTASKKS